jgi:ribosomal protein S12 methylthiotransferase accessory factor YcaO
VAQAVRRHQSAFIMTADASTFNVMSTSAGKGATREAAEADALAECRAQDPRSHCRIAAVQCGRAN